MIWKGRRIRFEQLRQALQPCWMKLALLGLLALGGCVFGGYRLNVSGSLPLGIYRVVDGAPRVKRGSVVVVCLPERWSRFAVRRQILGDGRCPGGSYGLGKFVAAVEGDVVTISPDRLLVNTVALANAQTLDQDHRGRAMPHHPWGRFTLREGEVWLYSCHQSAFDSRYFGPLMEESLRSIVKPVLVEPHWLKWACGKEQGFTREFPSND